MDDAVGEVLKAIGWDTGFRLPIANEENQKLERELAHLVIKKSAVTKAYDDATDRVNNLTQHLKYVRMEVQQNQTLLSNYTQQVNNEKHKLKLKENEKAKVLSEIRQMSKSAADIRERMASKKELLARHMAELEKIKSEADWDNNAMKAWEESIKKRDEDNELLKKFSAEDQRKLTDLRAKRNQLKDELLKRRGILSKMDVDITTYEQIMMRTGNMLNELKTEREGLVLQWQEAVKNLRNKDAQIKRDLASINSMQDTLKLKREEMQEQEDFLANEKNANKYLQLEINDANVNLNRARKEHSQLINRNLVTTTEIERKKRLLQHTAREANALEIKIKNQKIHLCNMQRTLEQSEKQLESLKLDTEHINTHSLTSVKSLEFMELQIQKAERTGILLNRKMQTLLNKQYKITCEAKEVTDAGNLQRAELCAIENALAQVRKRATVANQNLIYKKQLMSDISMKLACLEAQIGNTDSEEILDFEEIWEAKITELEETVAQHTEVKNLLHAQMLKLQKENLRLVNSISNDASTHKQLKDRLQDLQLQIDGGIKQTKAATIRTQQKQVAENVLQLKVDKLLKCVKNADKEIYNLQRYKIDLESTLKERHIELATARDVLFAKKKNIDEDNGRLRGDISLRLLKIRQTKNKYEVAIGLLGKDETGDTMNITTFKLRAAQERFQLQEEGDELEKKVRKAEAEILAMENTLKVVNITNKSFKNSLTFVEPSSAEAEEMKLLEEEHINISCQLKGKKEALVAVVQEIKELRNNLVSITKKHADLENEIVVVVESVEKAEREENDRKEKIARAVKQLNSCKKKIPEELRVKYDKDFYIRQIQDINKNIMYQLADLARQHNDIAPILAKHFAANKLDMPKVRTSMSSLSSDSIRSESSLSLSSASSSCIAEKPLSLASVTNVELTFSMPQTSSQEHPSTSRPKVKAKKPKK